MPLRGGGKWRLRRRAELKHPKRLLPQLLWRRMMATTVWSGTMGPCHALLLAHPVCTWHEAIDSCLSAFLSVFVCGDAGIGWLEATQSYYYCTTLPSYTLEYLLMGQ